MSAGKIKRLARLAGLEPAFEDAWGDMQRLSPERMMGLLSVLRLSTDGEEEIEASIARLEGQSWQRTLAPVYVARRGMPPAISIVLPRAAAETATLRWRVREANGKDHHGGAHARTLALADEARIEGRWLERRTLELTAELEPGEHTLWVESDDTRIPSEEARLIIAPRTCFMPRTLQPDGRTWGFAVQLYALRSRRNWGIGDFTDLFDLIEIAEGMGAGIIGINPLHAPFLTQPERASPYSPSSRLFLNVLYVDVERVPEYAGCHDAQARVDGESFQRRLEALRADELVDYRAVAECKLEILAMLYRDFRDRHLGADAVPGSGAATKRGDAFRRFQREGGKPLRAFATFEALSEHLARERGPRPWERWPERYRDPNGEDVQAFAASHVERIEYFEYLQWAAAQQLAEVGERCSSLDMPVGLYLDLAIGVARDGADVWADQAAYVADATVGAPPDVYNPMGQDWGLPPLHPRVLSERAYHPLADVLAANMKHAGALRIDHVLALMHLYWTPADKGPEEGGYVRYPLEDLLGILALESHRARCMVIGEDLGTVPASFKQRLQKDGILSYKLLYFEKDEGDAFLSPAQYPRLALAAVTTHDLATLPGYWAGRDLKLRERLGLFPSPEKAREAFEHREQDRRALLLALEKERLLNDKVEEAASRSELGQDLLEAIHAFLARSPAVVLTVQIEDVLGQLEQVNVPGTTDEYPNWRRKLALNLDELAHHPELVSLARTLRATRPGG